MNHLKRKAVIIFIVMSVLTGITAVFLYRYTLSASYKASNRRNEYKLACVDDLVDSYINDSYNSMEQYSEKLEKQSCLMIDALDSLIRNNAIKEPCVLSSGVLVKYENSRLAMPEDIPDGFFSGGDDTVIDTITGDSAVTTQIRPDGTGSEPLNVTLEAFPIRDSFYYITWILDDDYEQYSNNYSDFSALVPMMEETFSNPVLLVYTDNDKLEMPCASSYFPEAVTAKDIGFTPEMIKNREPFLHAGNGVYYNCVYHELKEQNLNITAILLDQADRRQSQNRFIVLILTGIMLIFFIPLIVWHMGTQSFVHDRILPARLEKRYHPKRMRSLTFVIGIIGSIIILFSSVFVRAIDTLRSYTTENMQTLEILFDRIHDNAEKTRQSIEVNDQDWMLQEGHDIAFLLLSYPELMTQEMLSRFASDIGADYIMIFDEAGNELLSSNDYSAFSLYMLKSLTGTDFPYLLNGVSDIVSDPVSGIMTDNTQRFIGITLANGDSSSKNGALIIAFPETKTADETQESRISSLLYALVPAENLFLAFDEESGKVLYSNDSEFVGFTAEDMGISKSNLHDRFMNFFHVAGMSCYGISMKKDTVIYYYIIPTELIYTGLTGFGLNAAAAFALIFLIISVMLLAGYTEKVFREWEVVGESTMNMTDTEVITGDGRRRRSIDPTRRWAFSFAKWRDLFPDQKVGVVLTTLTVLFLILFISFIFTGTDVDSSLLYFVLNGAWERGFNLFAAFAIIIIIAIASSIVITSGIFLRFICRFLGTKGETVCRLIYNIIQYASVLISLYFGFGYLGFDTTTIVASLGLISLALSLGAKDLVADILAGLSIVFEGEFQVGDIIEIDGYRGTVQEIGVRTTKLLGRGDNIKIIRNADIKNVINMTRLNSWYSMDITILSAESLHDLEDILARELPKIGEKNKQIISGPYYRGVTAFTNDTMTISITTECKEQNFSSVQRYVNKEIRLLMSRERIPMK